MPDTPADAEAFARLALELHDVEGLDETVERILEFAVKTFGCGYAGVILVHAGSRVETVAATHPVVAGLDSVQLEAGEGPDLELIADRHEVVVADVRSETRWPRWCEAVADAGIRSMMGSRLYTSQRVVGSLNLYDPEPGAFDWRRRGRRPHARPGTPPWRCSTCVATSTCAGRWTPATWSARRRGS